MAVLHLQFRGVLQSWGIREDWMKNRRTESSPTESAVLGLIGCAMGIDRGDRERAEALAERVRIIPKNTGPVKRLRDDQSISLTDYDVHDVDAPGFPSANGGIKTVKGPVISEQFYKDYIEDRISNPLLADVEGDDEIIEKIRYALLHPVYPYYLGRYCCIPCGPVVMDD